MAQPTHGNTPIPAGGVLGRDSGGNWYIAYVDSDGALRVKTQLDFAADIEIVGEAITNRRYAATSADSWTTLITASASQRIKIFKCFLSVSDNVSGEIKIRIGSNEIAGQWDAQSGGQYVLLSAGPGYEHGALNDDFEVYLPAGFTGTATLNVGYTLYTP